MGVTDLPTCRPGDIFCLLARAVARRGVYSTYAQAHIVQAQYFRDHTRLQMYYDHNKFLTMINGEVEERRNETFKRNLLYLENFVMIMFDQDSTVVPKESSWFGSYAPPQEHDRKKPWWREDILPMQEQLLYQEDWIGLRKARALLLIAGSLPLTIHYPHSWMKLRVWHLLLVKGSICKSRVNAICLSSRNTWVKS